MLLLYICIIVHKRGDSDRQNTVFPEKGGNPFHLEKKKTFSFIQNLSFCAQYCHIDIVTGRTPCLQRKGETSVFRRENISFPFFFGKRAFSAEYCHTDIYYLLLTKEVGVGMRGGESDRRNSVFPAKGGKVTSSWEKEKFFSFVPNIISSNNCFV